ncbi:MAG: hypothetical protein GWN58_33050 [Anaerolineae bacterium]|nr:hypothetical protein [Thermoplasmata archaeon]NIV34103.1 hypothetical protein [Anaerolineae bacterium]NIY05954.1 hypothetical protein [Thermoplasmata archaeon]
MENSPVRILSYGGGLDSWTMLLLAIDGKLPKPDLVIFADVSNGCPEHDPSDPGEWPSTYRHIREVAMPLCEAHGIEFKWLTSDEIPVRQSKNNPDGFRSLYAYFRHERMFFGARSKLCTIAAKVDRIGKYVEARYPEGELEVWIGFGADEQSRLKDNRYAQKGRRTERYPLMELGMCRCREEAYARASGYPVPRKSACVFCPHSSRGDFQTLARELPEWFAKVEEIEHTCKLTGEKKRAKAVKDGLTEQEAWEKHPGRKLRYSGTGDDKPVLREWVATPFKGRRENETCPVCGDKKATKRTGCDFLCERTRSGAATW